MNIGLLGFGVVGRGVYDMLAGRDDIRTAWVLCRRDLGELTARTTYEMQDILDDPAVDTVVEVMGGLHPAYEYVAAALRAGKNVVSSNKYLMCRYYDELTALAKEHGAALRCTAAVGGGIPWLTNRGKNLDVTIVKSIINPDGSEISRDEYESYVNEKLGLQQENVEEMNFKEENIEAILEGMRGVTSESGGTAYSTFRNFNIEVGGKTGSAQTGVQGKTNAWFVGFAPFDDPEIAIVVFVRNGGHGSYTAEVARDIIAQYFGMNTNQVTENTTAIPTVQIIN